MNIDFDLVTRLMVAAGYASAALSMFAPPQLFKVGKAFRAAWVLILGAWTAWYVALALFDPDPRVWGVLNRALHLPLVAMLIVQNLAARRFYQQHPGYLKVFREPADLFAGNDPDGT